MSHRILVADDSSTIQKVIKIALSKYGVDIVESSSFVEALGEVTKTTPDALIIDASLPGAHGADDFAKLKDQGRGVPLLVLVGTYEKVDENSFEEKGLGLFLKKPFESSDIVKTVDEMLGGVMLGASSSPAPAPDRAPPPSSIPTNLGAPSVASESSESVTVDLADTPKIDINMAPPPPPPGAGRDFGGIPPGFTPETHSGQKGMPAFGDSPSAPPSGFTPPPPPPSESSKPASGRFATTEIRPPAPAVKGTAPKIKPSEVSADEPTIPPIPANVSVDTEGSIAQIVAQSLPNLVQEAVEDYCNRHFKSLAKEVITSELRRLADEKARHLVDG